MRHRRRITLVCAALVSLLAGALIYALFRRGGLPVFGIGGGPAFRELSAWGAHSGPLGYFLVYNVPDGLWLLSGILCVRAVWLEQAAGAQRAYVLVFCALAMLFEALQWFRVVPGTFDVLDMFAMAVTAFGESVYYINFVKKENRT